MRQLRCARVEKTIKITGKENIINHHIDGKTLAGKELEER